MRLIGIILSVIILISGLVALGFFIMRSEPERREATFFPMGGIPFKVVVYGRTPEQFNDDMEAVRHRVAELEMRFNRFKEDSELAAINSLAAGESMKISEDMQKILALCRDWNRISLGTLDPTVTPLIELWKTAAKEGSLPDQSMIADARSRVGFHKIRILRDRISLPVQGMSLDFGAMAKGLIADDVANLLMRRGVGRGVIDAAGNGLAFGAGSFRFGIQDPLKERGRLMGAIDVSMGGVMTSGNYERFVTIGDKRYSHIIDPRTGLSVDNGMVAVTVVGGTGAAADALDTALMVLGRVEGQKIMKSLKGYEALMVESGPDGPVVWISAGLAPRVKLTKEWADRVRLF